MPQHIDSWIVISRADFILKEEAAALTEPFSGSRLYYPIGSYLSFAVIKSISGLDMIYLARLIPAMFFVVLGLLLYSLSNALFKNDLASISVMAFTPLSLSNITILGPYYLVPVAWGILLSLLFFYFILKEKWIIGFLTFIALAATHTSSTVFSIIGIGLYFIFDRKYWHKVKYLFLIGLASIILFSFTRGIGLLFDLITSDLFAAQKSRPYISIYMIMPIIFIVLLALGFYFILTKEKRAAKFLIPLFSVLAINAFIYWYWKGFFIVYRRLFTFTFVIVPFFAGYSIYKISNIAEKFISKRLLFIKKYNAILLMLLIILVPLSIKTNIKSHKYNNIYVDEDEHQLFTGFGKLYPDTYIATDYLQAHALPYYNLKPVQLSPAHVGNVLYFNQLAPCYNIIDSEECFGDFFYTTNFSYLYSRVPVNISYFKPFFNYNNKIIYMFERDIYKQSRNP
jgi:hypothetical protein